MDSRRDTDGILEAAGLSISLERALSAASLRYLDPAGEYARAAERVLGVKLPAALEAVTTSSTAVRAECILAWRSPTETLLLSTQAAGFGQIAAQLIDAADGCTVDQTGALWAVRVLPAAPRPADKFNPFVQKHRLLSRPVIEEWLDRLRLVQTRLSASLARSSR